jgi:hypothetical protein
MKMIKNKNENNQLNQKQLYYDALVFHLINSGFSKEKARFIIEKKLKNSFF